jgi:hypothetical protein
LKINLNLSHHDHHWQSQSIDFPEKTRKQLRTAVEERVSEVELARLKTLFSSKLNIPSPRALALTDICKKVDGRQIQVLKTNKTQQTLLSYFYREVRRELGTHIALGF